MSSTLAENKLLKSYLATRSASEALCAPLITEDYVVQPVEFVSPPKWHLGHTTWFFENMVLLPFCKAYQVFDAQYNFVFNSYYESLGARVIRTDRGNLSRPSVRDVYAYRKHVDTAMNTFIHDNPSEKAKAIIVLGCHHEQQHQELLLTDIKYILGHNPLFPAYSKESVEIVPPKKDQKWIEVVEGVYEIGFHGQGFCFDNELNRHQVFIPSFEIATALVYNDDYASFIDAGGYENFKYWHSQGWEWINKNGIRSPLYWYKIDSEWHEYTLSGLHKLNPHQPVTHISFYEAYAYANWKGFRLPTEFEWEVAADQLQWGKRWEWTGSAYLPYPGFKIGEGALGEYNGKFMVNQMVLRGASLATPPGHARKTYRNFFQPELRWQFNGIRLAK